MKKMQEQIYIRKCIHFVENKDECFKQLDEQFNFLNIETFEIIDTIESKQKVLS